MKTSIQSLVLCLGLLLACVLFVQAAESQSLGELLIALDGWGAEEAETVNVDAGGLKMISATREYTQNDMNILAVILVGSSMLTEAQMMESVGDISVIAEDSSKTISEIDGFKVQTIYDGEDTTSSIVVYLAETETHGGIFTFVAEGLAEEDALAIAKQFDWEKMRSAVEARLQ